MSIRTIVYDIENHFVTNWTYSKVHYEGSTFNPDPDTKWISILIAPVGNDNRTLDNCIEEVTEVQIIAYGANKVEAGELMDYAISFLQNTTINGSIIRTWRTLGNGTLEDGTYFYKSTFLVQT